MVTLRCTRKLQKFLHVAPSHNLELTTAALGDWYANLVPSVAGDLVVFVNERSFLTAAFPISESSNLAPVFRLRVANLLGMLGIDPKVIALELSHLAQIQFGNTVHRGVVSTMNGIAAQLQFMAEDAVNETDLSLSRAELLLSRLPTKLLKYRVACDVARELLGRADTSHEAAPAQPVPRVLSDGEGSAVEGSASVGSKEEKTPRHWMTPN